MGWSRPGLSLTTKDFFESIIHLLKTLPKEEIQFQSDYSKQNVRKLVESYTPELIESRV